MESAEYWAAMKHDLPNIIAEWLDSNGYDGLFYGDDEACGCILGDLMPCMEPSMICAAGYIGQSEYVCDDSWWVWATKRPEHDRFRKRFILKPEEVE